jgi:hypothetical protein
MDKIIEITSSILTPLTAIIVVYIAIKQYKLEKFYTKIDLYETRLPIYQSVMVFISKVIKDADIKLEDCFQLLRETSQKSFLFKPEVNNYIDKVYKKGLQLNMTNKQINALIDDSSKNKEYQKICEENHELLVWFGEQFKETEKIFGKYLIIDKK